MIGGFVALAWLLERFMVLNRCWCLKVCNGVGGYVYWDEEETLRTLWPPNTTNGSSFVLSPPHFRVHCGSHAGVNGAGQDTVHSYTFSVIMSTSLVRDEHCSRN